MGPQWYANCKTTETSRTTLPPLREMTLINTLHQQVQITAHQIIALSQQLEQNYTFLILCNTVMLLMNR